MKNTAMSNYFRIIGGTFIPMIFIVVGGIIFGMGNKEE